MRYDMLEHAKMKAMRDKHPEWIWNRSDTHVILGVPGTLDAFKTPVEPGNSFSPGPGTYGVSAWVSAGGLLHTPERMAIDALAWRFEDGYLPVVHSSWMAGGCMVRSSLFTDGDVAASDIRDYLTLRFENPGNEPLNLTAHLALRSFGAAGRAIRTLKRDGDLIHINGAPSVYLCDPSGSFGAVSYQQSGEDVGCLLARGVLPTHQEVEDATGWASGAVSYKMTLAPGEQRQLSFVFRLHEGHWMLSGREPMRGPFDVPSLREQFLSRWRDRLAIRLNLPDRRFTEAFYSQLSQLYMFTVSDQPRISPVSYPLWWLRDGAYVVNALNKGGFHEFAEKACRGVADKLAFGGFGSEGDAPGSLIWILSEHYLLTRDRQFLADIYPKLVEKAQLLMKMRRAEAPVKVMPDHVIPQLGLEPNLDMLCLPARDGLIMGRMDGHFPILWVNSFAYLGLTRMAAMAREVGEDPSTYEREAEELKQAILKKSFKIFGKNDRDVNCAFWPTGWASKDDKFIMGRFDAFWNTVRCPGGRHVPEPEWTYFEAGQAHNNVLNGHRDRAWVSIEMFLTRHTAPGLYTYHEGTSDENSSLLWQRTRGWDDIRYVTPHGWTAAELFLLLRDCLIHERDGELVIGAGIPTSWQDKGFSFENLPSFFGEVSVWHDASSGTLRVRGEGLSGVKVVSDLPWEARVVVET